MSGEGADGGIGVGRGQVPQPHRAVPRRRGQGLAVGRKGHVSDLALVSGEGADGGIGISRGQVPQPHRAVPDAEARVLPSGAKAT